MEPVQIGRGDSSNSSRARVHKDAAMEPVQIGRGDVGHIRGDQHREVAAMEPVQIGRGDVPMGLMVALLSVCRNGARPDRTG